MVILLELARPGSGILWSGLSQYLRLCLAGHLWSARQTVSREGCASWTEEVNAGAMVQQSG